MAAPPHPFPVLQGPFEESMTEVERHDEIEVPSDAASRRTILLDAPTYERVIAGRWKQRLGEKYHPLWKIVAQLSFGIHLLAENLAKSEEEVMQILQGHIDEIDLFLERTTEDFTLAHEDIQERMRCLQLPLQHPKVFDRMLEDRTFRLSIVDGNEKIEHIVARTRCATKDSLKDAQKGLDATASLQQYLAGLEDTWGRRSVEHEAVYEAMIENVEGWYGAFLDLQSQGDALCRLLRQLTEVINQMQLRAGEVSRRLIRAQQKQGQSPLGSNNVTYVTRQSTSSAGAQRSDTPDRPARKPLPGVPEHDAARHSAAHSQRSATALSSRSVNSQRSSGVQHSRAPSREGVYSSASHSAQARLSAKSPRLVEIRRHSPLGYEFSQSAPTLKAEALRTERSVSQPVELPAAPGASAFTRTSAPAGSTVNAGLGIMQPPSRNTPSQASDYAGRVTTQRGSARLPLTPSSMASTGRTSYASAHELPSEPVVRHVSAPPIAIPKAAAEPVPRSPPSTPGWAKQKFDLDERKRMVQDKTAFRSHPPNADMGSPPIIHPTKFNAQAQHARPNDSIASSLGAPGPSEHAHSEGANSIRSVVLVGAGVGDSPVHAEQSTLKTTGAALTNYDSGKKEFIAELEGTTPVLLNPTTYARDGARSVSNEIVELEVPQYSHQPQIISHQTSFLDLSLSPTDDGYDSLLNDEGLSAFMSDGAENDVTEQQMAAAIRKSFIATNVELADTSIGDIQISLSDREAPFPRGEEEMESIAAPRKASSKGVEDIIAQLEALNATSPNLSLNGDETLCILPATTYKAEPRTASRSPLSPALRSQDSTLAGPESSTEIWSKTGTPLSKPEQSSRNSLESVGSSQSQWRAFFKGQLSPGEFDANTPNMASKSNSTHKAIVELQRRGQESSPTLGWQWAPETPEIEGAKKRMNRYV